MNKSQQWLEEDRLIPESDKIPDMGEGQLNESGQERNALVQVQFYSNAACNTICGIEAQIAEWISEKSNKLISEKPEGGQFYFLF